MCLGLEPGAAGWKAQTDPVSKVRFCLLKTLTENFVICRRRNQCDQKNRQMSIKVAQNDFTKKMKDFDTFTKIA